MGNCCNGNYNDNDIEKNQQNNQIKLNEKGNYNSSLEYQDQSKYNAGIGNIHKLNTDSYQINNQEPQPKIQEKNLFISKTKLNLIVKQSKCLLEGKEYLINSLGLTEFNNKNNHQDGLVIVGDIDVSLYY